MATTWPPLTRQPHPGRRRAAAGERRPTGGATSPALGAVPHRWPPTGHGQHSMPSESSIICAAQGMAGLQIVEHRRPKGSQPQTRAGDKQPDTRVSTHAGRVPDRPGRCLAHSTLPVGLGPRRVLAAPSCSARRSLVRPKCDGYRPARTATGGGQVGHRQSAATKSVTQGRASCRRMQNNDNGTLTRPARLAGGQIKGLGRVDWRSLPSCERLGAVQQSRRRSQAAS